MGGTGTGTPIPAATTRVEPVTLAEVKSHLRIDHDLDDALLSVFISAAREYGENLTNRKFVEEEVTEYFGGFPAARGDLVLSWPDLQSVASVAYLDEDGVEQTLVEDIDFTVDTSGVLPRLRPVVALDSWPDTYSYRKVFPLVTVTYRAGWPTRLVESVEVSSTPANVKAWCLIRIGDLYENRESVVVGQAVSMLPRPLVDGLLDKHCIVGV